MLGLTAEHSGHLSYRVMNANVPAAVAVVHRWRDSQVGYGAPDTEDRDAYPLDHSRSAHRIKQRQAGAARRSVLRLQLGVCLTGLHLHHTGLTPRPRQVCIFCLWEARIFTTSARSIVLAKAECHAD